MKDKTIKLGRYKYLCYFLISFIYKEIFFQLEVSGKVGKKSIVFDVIIGTLIYFIIFVIFNKKYNRFIFIFDLMLSILMFSDIVFNIFYRDFITIGIIKEIGQIESVSSQITNSLALKEYLFFLDLPILFYLLRVNEGNKVTKMDIGLLLSSVIILIGSVFSLNAIFPNLVSVEYSRKSIESSVGFIGMKVIDCYNYIENNVVIGKMSNEEILNINNQLTSSNYSTSEFLNKNLIIIQVESLQEFVINRKYDGNEITPNLNKLINESAYFSNCYYQIGVGHTSDAELLSNTSLYPMKDSSVFINKYNNEFNALPEIMKNKGYTTFALHGNDADYWNRGLVYKKFGFDKFYSLEDFKKDEMIEMGLSDKSFLSQSLDIIKNSKKPFYSFLVTITSHGPFKVNQNNFTKNSNNVERYYNAINYTDKCLGEFIDGLKSSGVLDNSILIIYGDHNAMTMNDKNEFSKIVGNDLGNDVNWTKYQKVPLIIRLPNQELKGIYTKSVGQNDILPTLLNIYGINNIKTFGRSIFDKGDNLVVLRDGSYVYGNQYYDAKEAKTYNLVTNILQANSPQVIQQVENQLKASDDILKYNYDKKVQK